MFRSIFSLMLVLAAPVAAQPVRDAAIATSSGTSRLIVRLGDSGPETVQAMRAAGKTPAIYLPNGRVLNFVRRFQDDGMIMRLPDNVSLEEAYRIADEVSRAPGVASAVPDKRIYPALIPNDPQYYLQWHLDEPAAGIRMPAAWDLQTGSSGITIALLDTGIISHSDLLPARVLSGYDFISDVATANDGDGRDPDATDPGDATLLDECGPGVSETDSSWHGLAVGGVMIAQSDNLFRITGIDFAAQLLPVRVLGKCGGFISDIIDAMRWSVGLPVAGLPDNPHPARVINLSLSGAGICSTEEQRAIDDVVAMGAVVIAAAGNDATDVATRSPANCRKVIAVGAVDRAGKLASYSNTGSEVDLSAPGGDGNDGVLTLFNTGVTGKGDDTLAYIQGTSFTAAQVSAVASLMLATDQSLSPATLEELLRRSARAFPDSSCTACTCGRGILDAHASLVAAAAPAAALAGEDEIPDCAGDTSVEVGNDIGSNDESAKDGGGGGGGGCALQSDGAFDPLMYMLLLMTFIGRRIRSGICRY
ncbi:MAG: S8 family peptidase [Thiogranum sp.]|nr:S8 family peptidase [Thiogranum sp.]